MAPLARTFWASISVYLNMRLRRKLLRIFLILLLFPPAFAGVAGWLAAPAFLHPIRRPLTPDLVVEADVSFAEIRRPTRRVRRARTRRRAAARVEGVSRKPQWRLGAGVSRRCG